MPNIDKNVPIEVDSTPTTKVCALCGNPVTANDVVVAWVSGDIGFHKVKDVPKGVEVFCCTRKRAPFCEYDY